MSTPKPLKRSDYEIAPDKLAVFLLGKVLVVGKMAGRIIETEAYGGRTDSASHGSRGITPRNEVMFGPPGHLYVYFTYGIHYCANVVGEKQGECGAVLLRALAPISGISAMKKNRFGLQGGEKKSEKKSLPKNQAETNLCSGPAKLTQALGITIKQNGADLVSSSGERKRLYIYDDGYEIPKYKTSPRIGISLEREASFRLKHWRFYIPGDPNLSRKG